jgi:hypothetical protein
VTTWTIRFDDNGEGLSTGDIAELEGLVTTLGFSATISSAPPVLSRAAETLVKTKAMVEERLRSAREREAHESTGLVNENLDIRALEAVLESLSQEDG